MNDDVLSEYLSECQDMLDKLGILLGQLETHGLNHETLRSMARDIHTIKGSSQLFGFKQIGTVSHAVEDCLEKLRNATKLALPELIDLLYAAIDVIAKLFSVVRATKAEPPASPSVANMIARLEAFAVSSLRTEDPTPPRASATESDPSDQRADRVEPLNKGPLPKPTATANKPSVDDGKSDSIRVQVDLLDNLMNLVGELVLIRNQLDQVTRTNADESLLKVSQRLDVVTSEMQTDIMKTRMQPIGNILGKFQRVVRDLAKDLGKRIQLEFTGAETELDKTLIEAVRDPLMHLVRNAVDHGLETPTERLQAGKPEAGTIKVRAFHEGGQVVIQIIDDGRGLNPASILAKAVERGLTTHEAGERLTQRDVLNFIFLPGFSTAAKVSDLSGRGVGMDVVKTNIEKIGGSVDLASNLGTGTTVTLKIPLTLAIISAVMVRAGGERFGIPQVKLIELLRVFGEGRVGGIEVLQGRAVYRLRGELLPLVDLAAVLQIRPEQPHDPETEYSIAVVQTDRQTFGLVVDAIEDSADIVVKPLLNFLKEVGTYSGATVMGDGTVALILDVAGLATLAGLNSEQEAAALSIGNKSVDPYATPNDATEYLLVNVGAKGRYGLPLCLVSRLEEIEVTSLCYSGDQAVINYRDGLLTLLSVPQLLGFRDKSTGFQASSTGKLSVIVVHKGNRYYGLMVDEIIDVVLSTAPVDVHVKDREGILGALIDQGEVIVLIDAIELIQSATPKQTELAEHDASPDRELKVARAKKRLLLAEDSSFYRKQVTRILEDAGYLVTGEANGQRAYAQLEQQPIGTFALVVSDIEMPVLNGLDFARQVRGLKGAATLPMVALSSRFSSDDVRRGMDVGFSRYIEKINPNELINVVDELLGLTTRMKHAS